MATKKQQKRRQKARVHGYVRQAPSRPSRPAREQQQTGSDRRVTRTAGFRRNLPEPNYQRSLKRGVGLVMLPLAALWWFAGKSDDHTAVAFVTMAIMPGLVFIPFDYFMTGFIHRRFSRRQAAQQR